MTDDGVSNDPLVFSKAQLLIEAHRNRKGSIGVLGLTGKAGAGKTSLARELVELARSLNIPCAHLPLDYFYRMSSDKRRWWLEEGERLGPAEFDRRANQLEWWDFDRLGTVLQSLRRGEQVTLANVYHREQGGELTLTITVDPVELLIVDGVAICHDVLEPFLDQLIYLHASAEVRFARLLRRDLHRAGQAARDRFLVTERFERGYLPLFWGKIGLFVDTTSDPPCLLSNLTCEDALRNDGVFSTPPLPQAEE